MTGRDAGRMDAEGTSPGTARGLVNRPRSVFVHLCLVAMALVLIARAAQLQLWEAGRWESAATAQQVRQRIVTPPRGAILDATGAPLVETRELTRLAFTPRNIRPVRARRGAPAVDTRAAIRQGLGALGVHDSLVRRVLDSTRKWVELPGLYLPSDAQRLVGLPGVTATTVLKRIVSAPPGMRALLGAVSDEWQPTGGIEQELDSLLRGVMGRTVVVADGRGNQMASPAFAGEVARPGHTLTLTINQSLQEIAERELMAGLQKTGASGGDVVMLNPRDGAVLAMAGARDRRPALSATVLSQPYEPGSVMKPFIVSRALELQRVRPDERINTEGGKWIVAKRTITDEHKAASMSVRDVIRLSSNIGAVKIAQRLSEREEYEALRDFGFGTPTGLPYPAESRGRLPAPAWAPQTPASVAMGYEMSATPLQIAMAYAAIANGGELLQPAVIQSIQDADGRTRYVHRRQVVRRVMQPGTATLMRSILASVVDSGTAVAADLATFDVAGKSGTARRAEHGRYDGRSYNATFAAMFPAQEPQYVVVVRFIDPQGTIFGGTVAGGVVKAILQSALATRDASLDRPALASLAKVVPQAPAPAVSAGTVAAARRDSARFDSLRAPQPAPAAPIVAPARVIVSLPFAAPRSVPDSSALVLRVVPSVYGLDVRQATRTLHHAGFQVTLTAGEAGRTRPVAGTMAAGGSVVVLEVPK